MRCLLPLLCLLSLAAEDTAIDLEEQIGHSGDAVHRVAFCPMAAEGKGAHWLQLAAEIENPFFGASMFRCGEIRVSYEGDGR